MTPRYLLQRLSHRVAVLCAAMLLQASTSVAADANEVRADILRELRADRERMLALWPGEYDNAEQVVVDRRRGLQGYFDGGHAHVHSTVATVDVPGVGDHLLYVEDYLDGNADKLFRQKLYELSVDEERQAIVVTLHSFHEPETVAGAYANPALLADITRDDLKNRAGCEMYFRPLGDGYLGAFDYGECLANGDNIADNRIYIAPGLYWFSDQFRPASEPQPNPAVGQQWHRLMQVDASQAAD